jgi:tetratricopeptide (TPR) repeat protein
MKALSAILTAFLFLLAGSQSDSAGSADAIRDLERMVENKQYSTELFFNLGNAYFKDNKIGPAILSYERALWLDPSDPDARANLKFVRNTAGLFESPKVWWQMVPGWASLNAWGWTASISWFLLSIALVLRGWRREPRWASVLKPVIAVLAVTLAVSAASLVIRIPDMNRAVVLTADAPLRMAPAVKSPAPTTLRAGDLVRVESRRGSYYYLETEDGKTGWATDHEVEPIVPRS